MSYYYYIVYVVELVTVASTHFNPKLQFYSVLCLCNDKKKLNDFEHEHNFYNRHCNFLLRLCSS